jgi:glycerol-3-phosphate acyltransferase PlsY
LLGSINSAVIISRVRYGDDIRRHGSGNAGMTNMLRTYGKGAAVATLIGDVLKTAIAVVFASLLMSSHIGGWIAALFCMLGHIFPVYYQFKGGKGVLCAATAIGILSWETLLILLVLFVVIVAMSKYVSLGSIVAAGMMPLIINFINAVRASTMPEGTALPPRFNGAIAVLIALLVIWCHRSNIKRIQNRTENKLSFKKKSE